MYENICNNIPDIVTILNFSFYLQNIDNNKNLKDISQLKRSFLFQTQL